MQRGALRIDGQGVKISGSRIAGRILVFSPGVGGECDDGNGGCLRIGLQSSNGFAAVHHRKAQIHQDKGRQQLCGHAHPLSAIGSHLDHVPLALQPSTQPVTVQLIVFNQK